MERDPGSYPLVGYDPVSLVTVRISICARLPFRLLSPSAHLARNRSKEKGGDFVVEKIRPVRADRSRSVARRRSGRMGGDFRNGKILPDLYACDGQVILSMKQTEGST